MRAATHVQETPCAHLTTSVYIHLILICVPMDFNILKRSALSHPEQTIQDILRRHDGVTEWQCWHAGTTTLNTFIMSCFYIHNIHIGGQPVLLGFLRREEIVQRNFTELSVHFSVKKKREKNERGKKKKTSTWLSIHLLFSCVHFFEETTIVLPISNGFWMFIV